MMTQTPRDAERMHDGELLAAFREAGAHWAFDELRRRHLSLVYSTARRELGDGDMAEDVAQAVFLLLIRKASALRNSRSIASWLFQTTRLTARNARQQEARRHKREQQAQQMQHSQVLEQLSEAQMWASIEPHLHEALATLWDKERHAVLLRLFENKSAPEVARLLGISPNAAQMRVARGVEKLRRFLLGRGLPITSAALAAMLSEQAVQAAPLGLFAATSAGSASAAGIVSSGLVQGVMKMMKINAWKTMALRLGVAAVVAGSACGVVALNRGGAVANGEALPLPSPDSPALGTWRKGFLSFVLEPDGRGQKVMGRRAFPLRWTEQGETITFDSSEDYEAAPRANGRLTMLMRYTAHLSTDKSALIITKSNLIRLAGKPQSVEGIPVNWVLAKQ